MYENSKINNDKNLLTVRFKASNKIVQLYRNCMKLDEFLGNLLSVVIAIINLFQFINNFINNFEMKKMIVNKIFKAFQSSHIMMHKIRLIQEEYNEINYKQTPPNFNDNHLTTKG